MSIGHTTIKKFELRNDKYRSGGILRNRRDGRLARPLSIKSPIHVVFKAERKNLKRGLRSPAGFQVCSEVIKKYAYRFHIKIESQAICGDHIHMVIRLKKRSLAQNFFRVVAGQIAQKFENQGFVVTDTPTRGQHNQSAKTPQIRTKSLKQLLLSQKRRVWKLRPFTRIVFGWRALRTVIAYVRLNEKEAQGKIPYRKERLRGLSIAEWALIWA